MLEAVKTDGLIRFAVIQLARYAGCQNGIASSTWFGRLRKRVRIVWPDFDVSIDENTADIESSEMIFATGIPEDCLPGALTAKLISDRVFAQLNVHLWHTRQREVWQHPPSVAQED